MTEPLVPGWPRGGLATGPMRLVARGDRRLKVHVAREGWNHLLCGRPYGNKYYRELGDPRQAIGDLMCEPCCKRFNHLRKVYTERDGEDSIG